MFKVSRPYAVRVINCLKLFVVAMAMVDTCVQSITSLRIIIRLLCW